MVRWLIIYIFVVAALNVIGLTTVSQLLAQILRYIPNVISAFFVFILGVIIAGFVESLVKNAISTIDPTNGRLLGKVSSYTVMIIAILFSIGELGIAERFINTIFSGFVAALALSFGLAVGLGAKDIVKDMLTSWYTKLRDGEK